MEQIVTYALLISMSFLVGYSLAKGSMEKKLEALQDEYNTLVDRDPKTGRFVKSMRKLKHD